VSRPPVEVRRASVEDVDELLLLWAQARSELGHGARSSGPIPGDQIRPRLCEVLGSSETHVLIARHEGVAAGYAVLRLAPLLTVVDGPALHVDHLFVIPAARRRGVARALLVAATAIAERHGAEQVLAGAAPSAKDAHRFLARLGFSPLIVRRVVGTATLRRRLAGEGQRRGLEDLLSRRRSLRARGLRVSWPGGGAAAEPDPDDDLEPVAEPTEDAGRSGEPTAEAVPTGATGASASAGSSGSTEASVEQIAQIDLEELAAGASCPGNGELPLLDRRRRARA
jgi:GNAT superfamily N-acetyltransferase